MEPDIGTRYEIPRTAEFLRAGAYTRVALQFPDEMLKDAAAVARALRQELASGGGVRVFVMADTAYNSCCVDEVGASHIDAQCVVHYGHACMSPTSNLPAFFVFGKAPLDVHACACLMLECSRKSNKRILEKMEDYLIFWIGQDNSAFANIVLTFNKCEIVRYDATENQLSTDVSHLMKVLRRRYYLVEKAKDASIIGILVGTLGVAGYLHIIKQMKELIKAAGKKSYTLVMGRPNSAKLANFPECEVFVYVSCAQTALLDSKDFLAPVITPFEAVLAFSRGREWTGEYLLDFKDLITSEKQEVASAAEEARFSFIKGAYVEDNRAQENMEQSETETSLALAEVTEKALSIQNQNNDAVLYQGRAMSSIDYLKARSYRGLTGEYEGPAPDSILVGRTGRAAGYSDEKTQSAQ
uniref:2-(3-amino-3-carboxypropyl)histidine synthase n=1 Tax=Setaria viridis TaxID=4556 RepID=A0A4U6UB30_SETVI|nr:hypothetical protein SEVIR_6G243500v2 [Setaria viridis]